MPVTGACSTCGEPVTLQPEDGRFAASGCACTRRRSGTAPARHPSRPAPKAPQKRTQRGERPFAPTARVRGKTLTLWLPRVPMSREGPNGRSWKVRAAAAVEWRELVAVALATLGDRRPRGWSPVRVTYVVHGTGRSMDRDNLVSCMKPVLDGLVRGGVMPDDTPEHVPSPPDARSVRSVLPWGFVVVEVKRASREEDR